MDTDVLVVGAGPTGLMLANQLVRRGIRTLIIDQHAGPSVETKAIGVQARTLEIYSHLGIVERALELGKRGSGGNIWADGHRRARVGLSDAGDQAAWSFSTPIHFSKMCVQIRDTKTFSVALAGHNKGFFIWCNSLPSPDRPETSG